MKLGLFVGAWNKGPPNSQNKACGIECGQGGRSSQNCWRGIVRLRFEPQPFIICLATKAQSHGLTCAGKQYTGEIDGANVIPNRGLFICLVLSSYET